MVFISISEPTTISSIILPTVLSITDADLDNIDIRKRNNSAHISRESQNDLSDDKNMKNGTNLSTNSTITKTNEKSVSVSTTNYSNRGGEKGMNYPPIGLEIQ